ncbi:alcohol acyl transferase 1 allele GSd-like [Eucalyptus grandis]|uniref:alcohol acyl transferase 1 allele GSd-like n=1 Tax=Eucalyptus grandis TaxID=71139 RepID=UPI00192EE10C|nr:alcohol acyl transferase 1 allele GSd-like [Eucalyptus grandis]
MLSSALAILCLMPCPPIGGREDPARVVKEALGKALVYYYPLAGRIREGPNCMLAVDCIGEGILFVKADANVSLEELGDSMRPPCGFVDEVLGDVGGSGSIIGCPLLLVQVTRLKCGASSSESGSIMPLAIPLASTIPEGGCREILCARDPPRATCRPPEFEDVVDNTRSAAVTLDAKNMCRTIALKIEPDDAVCLSSMINARGKQGLSVPRGYHGNTSVYSTVLSKAGHLCNNPLGYAVELVKKVKEMDGEERGADAVHQSDCDMGDVTITKLDWEVAESSDGDNDDDGEIWSAGVSGDGGW